MTKEEKRERFRALGADVLAEAVYEHREARLVEVAAAAHAVGFALVPEDGREGAVLRRAFDARDAVVVGVPVVLAFEEGLSRLPNGNRAAADGAWDDAHGDRGVGFGERLGEGLARADAGAGDIVVDRIDARHPLALAVQHQDARVRHLVGLCREAPPGHIRLAGEHYDLKLLLRGK